MSKANPDAPFLPLRVAVLTVSDTRTEETDSSGTVLVEALREVGHTCVVKKIVRDDIYVLRAMVSNWIADDSIDVVLCTGGTGFTPRDNTPQALVPLLDREIEGFGELFRHVSYQEIGTSTLQSRSLAGIANHTLIFCLPGSPNACRTAWEKILRAQLDIRQRPCNFAQLIANYKPQYSGAKPCETRN